MLEWVSTWPDWMQTLWFLYITFHDFIQWGILGLIGLTTWGRRRKEKGFEKLLEHIHDELHVHIEEDATRHEELGQGGMSPGV